MPRFVPPRRELERVDIAGGNTGGLPPSLLEAIEDEVVAIGHGKGFQQEVPWPDLRELPHGHPLRVEWFRAMRE